MAEYALRVAQAKHASTTTKFHTLKRTFFQLAKAGGRVSLGAREFCAGGSTYKGSMYIGVSNAIDPSMCQHGGRRGC